MGSEARQVSTETGGEFVLHNDRRFKAVKEGQAKILVPESPETRQDKEATQSGEVPQQVFYNPIQQFNRDLSVLAIKAFGLEAIKKKADAYARKKDTFASKKRKRQEQRQSGAKPPKVEKLSGPKEDGLDSNGAAADQQDAAMGGAGGEKAALEDEEANNESAPLESDPTATTQAETNSTNEAGDAGDAHAPAAGETGTGSPGAELRILDALSATGLRALRYAHELPFPVSITANDRSAAAVKSIRVNVEYNKLEDKISVTESDALAHMYGLIAASLSAPRRPREPKDHKYDVIDLDPYGTAATFFDAAVQAVRSDGGLLCVTCTDAGVWASQGYLEKTFALYGGVSMKGSMSHEAGLRIILHAVATSAARYGLAIEPLLSLSIDFYCRIFVRIRNSPASVKYLAGKTMVVYSCDQGCGAWTPQLLLRNKPAPNKRGAGEHYKHGSALAPTAEPYCDHCGTKTHLAGPMYAGPIHSADFIHSILDDLPQVSTDIYGTTERIRGMLQTALEELPESALAGDGGNGQNVDAKANGKESREDALAALDPYPLFFMPGQLARAIRCQTPHDSAIRGALRRLGYHVTRSHCKPGSIKTDAPWSVIWEVMREWVRQRSPVKVDKIQPGTAAHKLLKLDQNTGNQSVESGKADGGAGPIEVVFDEQLGRERNKERLVRYQVNPRENWGPMNRAQGR